MKLRFCLVLVAAIVSLAPQSAEIDAALKTIKAADIQRHQVYLASDELEGREAGSEGGHLAALHIAAHLAALGFEGGASDGGYFHCFGGGGAMGELADANVVRQFKGAARKEFDAYKYSEDFIPHSRSRAGSVEGNIVIAGYGITAPEHGYDDWKGPTFKGAVALVMDGEPQEAVEASKFDGAKASKYSEVSHKIDMAEKAGAVALIVVSREALAKRPEFTWPPPADTVAVRIPVLLVSAAMGDKLAGKPLKDLRAAIDAELKPKSAKTSQSVDISLSTRPIPGRGKKNVLGIWRGKDSKLKNEYVVLGAHYDHVGRGTGRGGGGKKGEVHNGADDNASGTSTLLDIAEAIKETRPKRSIIVMWFDEEEGGLVGSENWCANPSVPMESIVGMLNVDMIGRNAVTKIAVGVEKEDKKPRYAKLAAILTQAEQKFRVKFDWNEADEYVKRSDQWNFMNKGVPVVFFFGGMHADYHKDTDDVEKINFAKEEFVGKIIFWIGYRIANSDQYLK